jgi:membrane fusion protein (multidrug efflux system)
LKSKYLVFLVFSIAACKSKTEAPKPNTQNQPVTVDVIVAGSSTINNSIEVNGTVVAYESTELHPEISGRLTYLNIPEGSRVGQGAVLAKINDADLLATVAKSRVQLELAQKTEERLRKLLSISGINQADYDAALNQVNSLKADIVYTQAQIDKTTVRAPFSGVLGLRMVSPGAYVTPATTLATLQQTDRAKIDFTVPEAYANLIRKGGVIVFKPNQSYNSGRAVITATEPLINATSRNLKVRAVADGGGLNPGSFVKVTLNTGSTANSIMVPTNAIIPDAKAKKVVVIRKGKGVFVDIETGLRDAGTAEITKGINPGDSIVVTGVLFVRPNAPVKIRSVKKLEDFKQ